ncbi:MAG TPA: 4-hydroxythreonine-4-phosphate dehydrogenase PdxA [Thermodesulfobacteriota bacterium]|nr:4-hydroxythreonine-4-phosphate dehydrogenase PdxA [Thermodesulfobacteriota bacterium]
METKPVIGIAMGDPNGIGAEVIVKALLCSELQGLCTPLVFGDLEIVDEAKKVAGVNSEFDIVNVANFSKSDLIPGRATRHGGEASLEYIKEAVRFALQGKVDAVVTAPISKESIHLAGSKYPGHTEMLRDLTGASNVAMMFEGGRFRVVLVTIHCALSEVPRLITKDRVLSTIELTNESLIHLFGIKEPKIVVCGLNPHAGEAGAFGNEESLHIIPAIEEARRRGINATGPLPADTLFYYANQGKWDAVVAMYHDQGLIPFKMLSFDDGVNVTLGLPIVRTSPDHGTAYDIAWKGRANPSSMIAAIKVAIRLVKNRDKK